MRGIKDTFLNKNNHCLNNLVKVSFKYLEINAGGKIQALRIVGLKTKQTIFTFTSVRRTILVIAVSAGRQRGFKRMSTGFREAPTSFPDRRAGGDPAGAQVPIRRSRSSALTTGSSSRCVFNTETPSSSLPISTDIFSRSPLGWILIYFVTLSLISKIHLRLPVSFLSESDTEKNLPNVSGSSFLRYWAGSAAECRSVLLFPLCIQKRGNPGRLPAGSSPHT